MGLCAYLQASELPSPEVLIQGGLGQSLGICVSSTFLGGADDAEGAPQSGKQGPVPPRAFLWLPGGTCLLLLHFHPEATRPPRCWSREALQPWLSFLAVTTPVWWLLQGRERAVDPSQVRAEALPGTATLHGAVPGPAPAAGHCRRGPAGRHPAAGPRLPGGGE